MVNLITVNSYFNLFPTLVDLVGDNKENLKERKLVFCEAKISLMAERLICAKNGGSFNTDVYSFGNYLRAKKKIDNVLSKEGSAMAVKRILSSNALTCLNKSRSALAPTMFELIIQLKSAKITPDDVIRASSTVTGVLKNKLQDVATVYQEYEKFILENGYVDQSSALSFLPDVILNSTEIENSDVFLVGFSGFTAQMREIVTCLLKKAKSVTAIFVEGENSHVFVNETSNFFRDACLKLNINLTEKKIDTGFNLEGQFITDNLFSENTGKIKEKIVTDKIKFLSAKNPYEEIERVASVIKGKVKSGECRYKDIFIALPDVDGYKDLIENIFSRLEIPYFLDERKISDSHPLITLILSYINAYRKGLERGELRSFFKNPLFNDDKSLTDIFENYIIEYSVNYGRIHNPFTFDKNIEKFNDLENLRQKLSGLFKNFNIRKMLDELGVQEKLKSLAENLKQVGENEQASITEQIYDAVIGVLNEMDMMLSSVSLPLSEYKNVFLSGVSALKLSIIPQYNDAVFIGGFREVGLAKAKYVFAVSLTSSVPNVSNDVALLSDGEIDELEKIKVLVEPKIRVVNHRMRENVAMALASFSDGLYLSYPIADLSGNKNVKSEVLTFFYNSFTLLPFPNYDGYMTYKQGFNSFAKACGEFVEGETQSETAYDFTVPSSFYFVTDKEKLIPLLYSANKEVKVRLDGDRSLVKKVISPTTVEDYYKCPYSAFASRSLKINDREDGAVGVLSVGNLMHDILSKFAKKVWEIKDETECDAIFNKIKESVLNENEEYKKFLLDAGNFQTVKRVLSECEKYCKKTFLSLKNSAFNQTQTEVGFSDSEKATYPAIKLLNGAVKMKGKIDRVDLGDKYFRVVDYKTGKADSSEKALFAGVKLQLYLYALAVQAKFADEKAPAGVYYLPISDKYEKLEDKEKALAVGKTVDDKEALLVQDKEFFSKGESAFMEASIDKNGKIKDTINSETLKAYMDYAVKMSESAVKNLNEGVIIASPYLNACEYCKFSAMCGQNGQNKRTLGKVDENSFCGDLIGEEDE